MFDDSLQYIILYIYISRTESRRALCYQCLYEVTMNVYNVAENYTELIDRRLSIIGHTCYTCYPYMCTKCSLLYCLGLLSAPGCHLGQKWLT